MRTRASKFIVAAIQSTVSATNSANDELEKREESDEATKNIATSHFPSAVGALGSVRSRLSFGVSASSRHSGMEQEHEHEHGTRSVNNTKEFHILCPSLNCTSAECCQFLSMASYN